MSSIMRQDIITLSLPVKITKALYRNNISTIKKLCNKSKSELMQLGLEKDDAEIVLIKVQLLGLNLKNAL